MHADGERERDIALRAVPNFQNAGPWNDAAVVRFETSSGANQLGYCRVHLVVEVADRPYMFVRWYTDRVPGVQNNREGRGDNVFQNSHIRNLPALAWNPKARSQSNRAFQMLPASALYCPAWVVQDPFSDNLFWHVKHPKLYMHQEEEHVTYIDE